MLYSGITIFLLFYIDILTRKKKQNRFCFTIIEIFFCLFFRKKLRGAVYDALVERKINENDPLFRPCFKKLFDICSVFAQNMPKDTNSTKKWLSVVANQNADSVINLEKALRQ